MSPLIKGWGRCEAQLHRQAILVSHKVHAYSQRCILLDTFNHQGAAHDKFKSLQHDPSFDCHSVDPSLCGNLPGAGASTGCRTDDQDRLNHGPCASLSTLRFLEAHAVPSEPVHGVGSNLDLIKANDTAQASERRRLGLFRCCDDPRPFRHLHSGD